MKKSLQTLAVCAVLALVAACGAKGESGKKMNLTKEKMTEKQKISYCLGVGIGKSYKRLNIEIDPDVLAFGLGAGIKDSTFLMTDQEMAAVLNAVTENLRAGQGKMDSAGMAEMAKQSEKNKKDGEAFLAENKKKPGVVTTASGLQYQIIKKGTGKKPTPENTVSCQYKGMLIDGTVFDSSEKHGGTPATFPVNGVIKGWQEVLPLMPMGSKWKVFIPAELAYADHGAPPAIGPGATLVFEIELVSIQ